MVKTVFFEARYLLGKPQTMKSLHKKSGPKYRDLLRPELEVLGPGTRTLESPKS